MKKDRTRLLIGILMTLVLFSSFTGIWLYVKEKNLQANQKRFVHLFVLTKDIPQNHRITDEDIELKEYPADVVSWERLPKDKILHRYAKIPLYKGEPLLAKKLSLKPIAQKPLVAKKEVKKERKKPLVNDQNLSSRADTIALPLQLFRNIDPTLKQGDLIDIVTIDPKKSPRSSEKFITKYVAIRVRVASFYFGTQRHDTVVLQRKEQPNVIADTINLEVTPKNVKNLLALYYTTAALNGRRAYNDKNKGHLWLIKCAKNEDPKQIKEKERLLVDYKRAPTKRKYYKKKKETPLRIDYEE